MLGYKLGALYLLKKWVNLHNSEHNVKKSQKWSEKYSKENSENNS